MALLFPLLNAHFCTAEPACLVVDGLAMRLEDGSLSLARDDPRAQAVDAAPAEAVETRLRALARELAGRSAERLEAGSDGAWLGPFPAAFVVMELALFGVRPMRLEARLKGREALLHSVVPAVSLGITLPPTSLPWIVRLNRPARLADVLAEAGEQRKEQALAELAVLHALGVVRPLAASAAQPARDPLAERLGARVARRLAREAPRISADEQRSAIAALWRRLDTLDHYTLLAVPRDADASAITDGFNRLAMRVHPDNAARLGLPANDAMLSTLFERAVDAYRTLIDPQLRWAYHQLSGAAQPAEKVDATQRQQEKGALAAEHVRRALRDLEQQEVSCAVDLLKEAARLDPSPDTWALLARAQARNPGWRRYAAQSWREVLRLRPDWAEAHRCLATVLEAMGDARGAAEHYRKTLALVPGDAEAQGALVRLGAAP